MDIVRFQVGKCLQDQNVDCGKLRGISLGTDINIISTAQNGTRCTILGSCDGVVHTEVQVTINQVISFPLERKCRGKNRAILILLWKFS
jgi:hypothetical protein